LIFGISGGLTYAVVANTLEKLKIDDPIDAVPVHFGGGLIGTILTAFFSITNGAFYGKGLSLLGAQLLGLIVFAAWSASLNAIPLLLLKGLGMLRIDPESEDLGMDVSQCNNSAHIILIGGQEAVIFSN
jgi:Amt family ammonium transporter